jgi:hypothetical protein
MLRDHLLSTVLRHIVKILIVSLKYSLFIITRLIKINCYTILVSIRLIGLPV